MDRAELSDLAAAGYSTYRIARLKQTSQTNVRYWLHKYGIEIPRRSHRCTLCGETNPAKFYGKKKQICARCDRQYTVERQRHMAARARAELGGTCAICGFDKYDVALAFHHIDASTKEAQLGAMRGWSWERVKGELAKCVLLCHNCHAAVHANLIKLPQSVTERRTTVSSST